MNELPTGWKLTTIGDIAKIKTGKTPPTSNKSLFAGNIPFFKPSDLDLINPLQEAEETLSAEGAYIAGLLPPHTVLVSCIGNLGKIGLTCVDSACNQQINAILPSELLDPRYTFYWAKQIKPWLVTNSSATTISIINKGRFEKAPIPLPPLDEQRRIVARLDALLARTRRAREELARVPALAERAKVRILEQFLLSRKDKDDPEISWTSIGEVGEVQIGRQRSPKNHEGAFMRPYIRAANITWKGLSLEDVSEMNFPPRDLASFKLEYGDVLLSEASGSAKEVGKPAIWKDEIANCCFQNTVIRIRPNSAMNSEYLYYICLYYALSGSFTKASRGIGIHHLGSDRLSKLEIPLRANPIQAEIVARIEAAFARIDHAAAEAGRALALLERTEQAALAKAFRGELG